MPVLCTAPFVVARRTGGPYPAVGSEEHVPRPAGRIRHGRAVTAGYAGPSGWR